MAEVVVLAETFVVEDVSFEGGVSSDGVLDAVTFKDQVISQRRSSIVAVVVLPTSYFYRSGTHCTKVPSPMRTPVNSGA
jgi:hypothetical protein